MSHESVEELLLNELRSKDTPDLIELLKRKGDASENDQVLNAVQDVLRTRQAHFPDASRAPSPPATRKERRSLVADSNATVNGPQSGRIQITFPKDGFIQRSRSEFKNSEDLTSYIAEVFSLPHQRGGERMSIKRKGKYQRVDHSGRPIYTFGDPILDLITDEHGWVTVAKETYHLLPLDLASS